MVNRRFDLVTPAQRACLRLVPLYGTGEISRLLGIAPSTVNNHISAAVRTLGVNDRKTAARLLLEHESADTKLPSEKIGIPTPTNADHLDSVFATGEVGRSGHTVSVLKENRTRFDYSTAVETDPNEPFSPEGGNRNDLSARQRLEKIGTGATKIVGFLATLIIAIYLLDRFVRSLHLP